jgi:hypothetical protein
MTPRRATLLASCLMVVSAPGVLWSGDVDGPDCGRPIVDFGSAPEGPINPYSPEEVYHFPSCLTATAAGSQHTFCTPLSTPPGQTGYIKHVQSGEGNYWLRFCSMSPVDGIDGEADGKYAYEPGDPSLCDPAVLTDPKTSPFDFVGGDGDAGGNETGHGINGAFPCHSGFPTTVLLGIANCGPGRTVYLNVLVDLNVDGDWNDAIGCQEIFCAQTCAQAPCRQEWVFKNLPISIQPGCQSLETPPFQMGRSGHTWTRVTLTDEPVDDDFPWAGSAHRPGGAYSGGETEDSVHNVQGPLPADRSTWGSVKAIYR